MSRNHIRVRALEEREKLLQEVKDLYGLETDSEAIDLSLRAAVQLHEVLQAEREDLRDSAEQVSGDAVDVQERLHLEF